MANWLTDALDYIGKNKDTIGPLIGIAGTAGLFGDTFSATNTGPKGYQGSIPYYTANRARVPNTYDPNRRPGSGGQRYFSDVSYTPTAATLEGARTTPLTPEQIENIAAAQQAGQAQAEGLAALNLSNPAQRRMPLKAPEIPALISSNSLVEPTKISPSTPPAVLSDTFAAKPITSSNDSKMGTGSSTPGGVVVQQSEETPRTQGIDSLARLAGYQNGGEVVGQLMANPYFVGGGLGLGLLEAGRQSGISPLDNKKTFLGKERPYTPDYEGRKPALSEDKMKAYKNIGGKALRQIASKLGVPLALLIPDDLGDGTMPENFNPEFTKNMAAGGLAGLAKGRYLRSPSDGMADKIPATIDKTQPAALSGGEYVIPADVVSHLGNGNSDAGAKVLDKMMERIRKTRTGNGKQGKEIDPNKLLPA